MQLLIQGVVSKAQESPVNWLGTNANTAINAEGVLYKSASNTQWNAGAYSEELLPYDENGWVETQLTVTNKVWTFGMSREKHPVSFGGSYIEYAIDFKLDGKYAVREFNTVLYNSADSNLFANLGDRFAIRKTDGIIEFLRNGNVFAQATEPCNSDLVVDVSFYSPGAAVGFVKSSFGLPSSILNSPRLVAYWPLTNNLEDKSGNGHHLVANSGFVPVVDTQGGVHFNGIDQHLSASNLPEIKDGFTFSLFVKPETESNYQSYLNYFKEDAGLIFRKLPTNRVHLYSAEAWPSNDVTSEIIPLLNNWQYLTVTWSSLTGHIKYYVNGLLISSSAYSYSGQLNNLANGAGVKLGAKVAVTNGVVYDTAHYFQGSMKEVVVYNYELNADEIHSLYSSGVQIGIGGTGNFCSSITCDGDHVGINNSNPTEKLDVNGAVKIGASTSNDRGAGTIEYDATTGFRGWHNNDWVSFSEGGSGSWTTSNNVMYTGQSQVGIGVTDLDLSAHPNYQLLINGQIGAKNLVIKADGVWPDYVFEKGYEPMSLQEIREYIGTNKHLPGVPSAQEIAEEGISVNEMMHAQMQKIEELTLLLIEMDAVNHQQERQLQQLQRELKSLKH